MSKERMYKIPWAKFRIEMEKESKKRDGGNQRG